MSRIIIKNPDRKMLNEWGILAHVETEERNRILNVAYGKFKGEIKRLTKEVDLIKFPRRKKSIVEEHRYNPHFKPQPHKELSHEEPHDTDGE